jgi:hypothetical protein
VTLSQRVRSRAERESVEMTNAGLTIRIDDATVDTVVDSVLEIETHLSSLSAGPSSPGEVYKETRGHEETHLPSSRLPADDTDKSIVPGAEDAERLAERKRAERITQTAIERQHGARPRLRVWPQDGQAASANDLYRVEIHQGGPAGRATFKWSKGGASDFGITEVLSDGPGTSEWQRFRYRNANGGTDRLHQGDLVEILADSSISEADLGITLAEVRVDGSDLLLPGWLPLREVEATSNETPQWFLRNRATVYSVIGVSRLRDDWKCKTHPLPDERLRSGDWVELWQSTSVGLVRALVRVEIANDEPTVASLPRKSMTSGDSAAGHSVLRRWNGGAQLVDKGRISLEPGIAIEFDPAAWYRMGDHWLIPVRPGTDREVVQPADPPWVPARGSHHYAPLAFVRVHHGVEVRADVRRTINPLAH